jgi:arabinose-5-phosphate isomerase
MKEDAFLLYQKSYRMQIEELQGNFEKLQQDSIRKAIELILHCKGKLVCTGMGKSGLIAQKLAATFSSTGTPAFFLHPGESLHGDLGVLQKTDLVLLLAKSGESDEVVSMLQVIKKMGIPIISILGREDSSVGKMSDVIIFASVSREADQLNLAPTASTTVSLVVGDALASAVSEIRGFKPEHFALFHPAGQLGKRLLLNVEDLLIQDRGIPAVKVGSTMEEVLNAITRPNLGGAMIVDQEGMLIGIITDGDLRRAIIAEKDILGASPESIMTKNPISVKKGTPAIDALHIMEDRPSQLSVIPVIDEFQKPVGLLRLHDLVKAGL